jgi:O-antigen ligase
MAVLLALFFVAALLFWHFSPRASLVGLGLAGLVGAAALLQWPILGVLYTSFSLFGHLARLLPGIDTAIVILTLSAIAARKLLRWDPAWRFPATARWVVLWLAWMVASIAWGESTEQGLETLALMLKGFLVFLVVLEAADSYRRIIHLTLAALAGALFAVITASYAGYRFFFGGAAGELSNYMAVETTRLYGLWFDPNYFALALLALMGLALALWRTRLAPPIRFIGVAGFAAVLVGVVVSLSRAALLSALVGLVACLWVVRKRLRILLFAGAVVTLVLVFLPIGLTERVETLGSAKGDASLQQRGRLVRGGIEMAIDAFPFGVGLGNFFYHGPSYVREAHRLLSHNSYVDVAAEGGIIALLFFGGFVISLFQATRAGRRWFVATELADNLALGLRISLIGFLVGAAFLSATVFGPLWWLAGLAAAKAACDRELAEQEMGALAPVR